jgi:methylenetetrahydrofolate dehydrogenase (NADP+)/methenyltetrahydrofolate cyclohydrolase
VLIDAGTSESGKKVIGDIDPLCSDKASLYTPVPGGIGPITIAILYRNIIKAHQQKHDK